jgi:hypothetical protein
MIVEVAHAIIRSKQNSRLKKFFLRIKARRGTKIGIVALARKVLCILYHLLVSREIYQEDLLNKPRRIESLCLHPKTAMDLDEIIRTIKRAGYEVRKSECIGSG